MAFQKRRSDEELLGDLDKDLQTLTEQGSLNGTTVACRARLQDAQLRKLDLTKYAELAAHLELPSGSEPPPEQAEPERLKAWEIDIEMAEAHLAALGIGPNDPVILCAYGSWSTYIPSRFDFHPPEIGKRYRELTAAARRAKDSGDKVAQAKAQQAVAEFNESQYRYDWDAVKAEHAARVAAGPGRDWERVKQELRNSGTPNLGFIGCPGGTTKKAPRSEIFAMGFLAQEVDQYAEPDADGNPVPVPKDIQIAAPAKAGLPEPTVRMDTGGKSVHHEWLLSEPCGVEEGETARRRLFAAINTRNDGLKCDGGIFSAHQPLRLAGGVHSKTGKRSTLLPSSGIPYKLDELMALCPEVSDHKTGRAAADVHYTERESEDKPRPGEQFPELPLPNGARFPLARALSLKTQRVITYGQRPGSDKANRYQKAHSLSCTLQAAARQLRELGQPYDGYPEELFYHFVVKSNLYEEEGEGQLQTALEKHWENARNNIGEPELTDLALRRAIRKWAEEQGLWKPTYDFTLWKAAKAKEDGEDWTEAAIWRVNATNTPEKVVEEALLLKSLIEEAPLTCYQGRFLRYSPAEGYFRHIPANTLKREIAGVLPLVHIARAKPKVAGLEETSHKNATDAKATACVKWLNTVLFEEAMDLVPAVAFANGTYLIEQGQLVAHNANYRLTWAIQGEFIEGATCPPQFHNFIAGSFGEEWLEVIRMVLRYLVDPTFKPSKVVLILGRSGSGKGTLERLIEAMFPPSCISVITSGFGDINHPDKIRQFVRGKRLVAFPDLQGRQSGVGTIYSMTDGGLLTSRTLHESDADEGEAFTGRVVICSTQPPSMEDAGNGMTRRMLVLRTKDDPNRIPDIDLDDKLRAELGAIVSWALQADRQAVKSMLSIGDPAGLLNDAKTSAEVSMDPIRAFIDTCLVPVPTTGDDLQLPDPERLYIAYRLFCSDRNHRSISQGNFISRLAAALPHLRQERRALPGSNSAQKIKAFFYGFDLAEQLLAAGTKDIGRLTNPNTTKHRDLPDYGLDRRHYREGGLADLKAHRPDLPDLHAVYALQLNDAAKPAKPKAKSTPKPSLQQGFRAN